MSLTDLLSQHNSELEAETAAFELQLQRMLHNAQTSVLVTLFAQLELVGGKIANTPANRAKLRTVDRLLEKELDRLGLSQLIDAFVGRFGGQMGWFKQVLEQTIGEVQTAKVFAFDKADRRNLALFQQDAAQQLEEVVSRATQNARYNALMGIGGLHPAELAKTISNALDRSPGLAKNDAATAISTFYRTISDLGYRNIEADGARLAYKYAGPGSQDPVIRPFCQRMMRLTEQGHIWTRSEIDQLDNGMSKWGFGNVFVNCGGPNCRHQFVLAKVGERAIGAGG